MTQNLESDPRRYFPQLTDAIVQIVQKASEIVRQFQRSGFAVETKADASPVTQADLASETYILNALRALTPEIAVIAEEEFSNGVEAKTGYYFWLVDPLDGTREFAAGSNDFTINIGLVAGEKPIFGVVALPAYHAIYYGSQEHGAFCLDHRGKRPIVTAPPSDEGVRVVASRHYADTPQLQAWLAGRKIRSVAHMGSAVKFMHVADGRADFYPRIEPTMAWDTAAPQAIVEAAGGCVVDAQGQPLRYHPQQWRNPPFVCTGFKMKGANA